MRKMIAVIIMATLLISGVTLASDTGRGNYTTPISPLTSWLNSNDHFYHDHSYDKYERGNPLGIGLDLILYEFEGTVNDWGLDAVEAQQKWDFNNGEYSGFLVGKGNLWKLGKKLIGQE